MQDIKAGIPVASSRRSGAGLRSTLQKLPSRRWAARRFVLRVVNSSMNAPLRPRMRPRFTAGRSKGMESASARHAKCMPSVFLEKDSHSARESVNFVQHPAKAVHDLLMIAAAGAGWTVERHDAVRHVGWNHGASRNGNRKRTRVRVACGGGIRPRGLGHQPIHGHFGRSVVGRELPSHVVLLPDCEALLRQRRVSRGPGLLAALTPRDTLSARMFKHEHHEQRTVRATRPAGFTVISAVSVLKCLPERPVAGRDAHQPSPRTRLRTG